MKPILALAGVLCLSIAATAQTPAAPAAKINLFARQAKATPDRVGFTHTGAGNIDVAQPSPDTVVVRDGEPVELTLYGTGFSADSNAILLGPVTIAPP